MDKIIIITEDGGEAFTAYGETEADGRFYLTDAETLEEVVEKVIPFAVEHEVTAAEIDLSGFPGFSRRAS